MGLRGIRRSIPAHHPIVLFAMRAATVILTLDILDKSGASCYDRFIIG